MRPMQPPKLKLASPKSDTPNRHRLVAGMVKRIRQSDASLLQRIADLGNQSDVAVLRNKPADLLRNRAFAEHQQKLRGAIHRLANVQRGNVRKKHDEVAMRKDVYTMSNGDWIGDLPHRAAVTTLKTAFQTWEDSTRGR